MATPLLSRIPSLFSKLRSGGAAAGGAATSAGRAAANTGRAGAWMGWGGGPGLKSMGPLWAFPGLYFGGRFVGEEIAHPLAEGMWQSNLNLLNRPFGQSPKQRALKDLKYNREQERIALLENIERQSTITKLQKSTAQHAAKLAAVAPHLYNQILAGRALPQGATVLGGRPRRDLIEQLASGMAQGQYSQNSGQGPDDFLSSLGV